MKEQIELKPCPFCGGEAKLIRCSHREYNPSYRVDCQRCYTHTTNYTTENGAKDAWNRRPPEKGE